MFDNDYGTINIKGQNLEIKKQSVEDLRKYLNLFEEKQQQIIKKQNEYLSELLIL